MPVKIATDSASIKVGDYLTSSDTSFGKAMKSIRAGPVIGKALEDWEPPPIGESGIDKILAFVNISYADPGNFLASLSLDSSGNLIAPKLKTDKLLLTDNVGIGASIPGTSLAYEFGATDNSSPPNNGVSSTNNNGASIDVLASLKNLDQSLVDLKVKQATSSSDIAGIQTSIASQSAELALTKEQTLTLAEQLASAAATLAQTKSKVDDISLLNLTPPETLLATGSANLANLSVTSEATFSIENGSEVNVAGAACHPALDAGSIKWIPDQVGNDNCGILYLQRSPLAQGLDIFSSKVVIDKNGNITTQGTIAASEVKTSKLTISNTPIASGSATLAASIGTGSIPAGQTSVTINASQISDKSKIFVTPRAKIGSQALVVESISAGNSFTVSLDHSLPEDLTFDWWIVQTE